MDNKTDLFDLNEEQQKRLLNLGLGSDNDLESADSVSELAALLLETLAGKLPVISKTLDMLPDTLKTVSQGLNSLAGDSIDQILQDSQADIDTLQRTKNCYKNTLAGTESASEREVLKVVYYAAIANALVCHDRKISKLGYDTLTESFSALLDKTWITKPLLSLFSRALEISTRRM